MNKYITDNPKGGYRFLRGIEPYSSGVTANDGYEIIHTRLASPMHWKEGLTAARRFVEARGLTQHAICAVELRCPEPHSLGGFSEFNQQYRAVLEEWDMLVDGQNPVARTNVSPVINPPTETVLHAFSFAERGSIDRPTFVVAGGGELPHRDLERQHIVRVGETTDEAMREKAECVIEIMRHRLSKLEVTDQQLTTIDVYTQHPIQQLLQDVLIPGLPMIPQLGVNWYYSRPPVIDIEFEMDMRGVQQDLTVELSR